MYISNYLYFNTCIYKLKYILEYIFLSLYKYAYLYI